MKRIAPVLLLLATTASIATVMSGAARATEIFAPGNLVVSVEGRGDPTDPTTYADNQAAPLSLYQFSHAGTSSAALVSRTVLPQTAKGANSAISGEYGSSSEGGLQLTSDGKHLIIMGYGVNAAAFNSAPFGTYQDLVSDPKQSKALGQSGSLMGQGYTAVPRVVALIGANGLVDTSTAVTGVFNGNNPRSAASVNGSSFYISGQGTGSDATGGVFLVQHGGGGLTPITGLNASAGTVSQDTRFVRIEDLGKGPQLFVSVDTKGGSNAARSFVGTLGDPGSLPTGLVNGTGGSPQAESANGPTMLNGFGTSAQNGKETLLTLGDTNGINAVGKQINLSPEDYFFANATTLYVADSGDGKQTSASNSLGDGGLQKWSLVNGVWTLDYTLAAGLNLVANSGKSGTTGLLGLAGEVVGDDVELFATNFTIGDTDPTFLYGITDVLADTTRPTGGLTETFTKLATAPADANFKGVSFAPTALPEPQAWALMLGGFGLAGAMLRRRRPLAA